MAKENKKKKSGKKPHSRKDKRMQLDTYFGTAGYTFSQKMLFRSFFILGGILVLVAYFVFLADSYSQLNGILYNAFSAVVFIIFGYPLAVLLVMLIFYIYTDMSIGNRKRAIEKVLPEFLHLAAANIRAGMPVDQALWSAIRPRFGVLAYEIELVAKQNMVGKDLSVVLLDFSRKYDSKTLKRTISLIVEGMDAGSEIGDLLENIALNIQDIQTRKESMSANVTSYVIFISFAVLFAAPMLFAVSVQLLRIVHTLGTDVLSNASGGAMGITISLSANAVGESDFFIFCIVSLLITSVMSNIIIAAIKTGNMSDALKNVPLYATVSITIFFAAQWILGYVFTGIL
jgi:Flp pilus assembly protein TadB